MTGKPRSFAHSLIWNLSGAGLPLAFAFLATPSLLAGYGSERFGFLTIIWALIGYFSIFDLGIGRALTKLVCDRLGSGRIAELPDLATTAIFTMCSLGGIACLLLVAAAPILVRSLQLEAALHRECVLSLRILGISIPFVIASTGFIGLLEARLRFDYINRIRLLMGMLSFAAPLLMLIWSPSLVPATIALAVSRIVTTWLYFLAARRSDTTAILAGRFRATHLRELLKFGSWVTLSNLISPLMTQLDKIVIGSIVAIHLLPVYAIPGDLINRLSFIPVAIIGVFFPAFSARWSSGNRQGVLSLHRDVASVMLATMLPIALTIYAFAPEALTLWMGREFSLQAAPLIRWLCVGLLANSFARIPHALLQAIGLPGTPAKLHLLELPIYATALWLLLERHGILGAAIAWSGRMLLDFVLLTTLACLAVPGTRRQAISLLTATAVGAAIMCISPLISSASGRLILCVAAALMGGAYAFTLLVRIHQDE